MLTLWTADPATARAADAAGVHRIGVDLEHLGKAERQDGRGTWISPHSVPDLEAITRTLAAAQPFARVNPLHRRSASEIGDVLAAGARVVMVPMVASASDAAEFAGLVGGRAQVVILVERKEAIAHLHDIAHVAGIDEIHVGLNDLAISFGLANRWALLAGDLMRDVASCVAQSGLPFGFGGIGRAMDTALPIPSDLIYAEYARTGATRALLARSFAGPAPDWGVEVARAIARLAHWRAAAPDALAGAHAELGRRVRACDAW